MSVHPKVAALAHQLGQLLRAYTPGAEEGHTTLELLEHVQAGLKDPAADGFGFVTIDLPVQPDDYSHIDGPQPPFPVDAGHHLRLSIGASFLVTEHRETVYRLPPNASGSLVIPSVSIALEKRKDDRDPALYVTHVRAGGTNSMTHKVDR